MRSETVDRIIGSVLLIVGIAILIFVLTSAFSLATAPGDFFREQIPEEEQVEGPTSEFSWSSNNLDVTFTDESQEGSATISSWNWNFGDGGSSSDSNPSHPYTGDNQYEVTLEVQDENGKRSTARANVNVASGDVKGTRAKYKTIYVENLVATKISCDRIESVEVISDESEVRRIETGAVMIRENPIENL